MSLFSTILSKLGLGKPAEETPAAPAPAVAKEKDALDNAYPEAPKPVTPAAPAPVAAPPAKPAVVNPAAPVPPKVVNPAASAPPVVKPAPVAVVDVVKKLEKLSEGSGLNWKVSIVDLLKLLDIDSSREARKELATELGCPAELMGDSAKMNTWLHKTVLTKIAENGGNIPKELLD